jgi:regulator of ribonuclease activity A
MRATTDLYDDFEDTCNTCSIQFRDFGGRKRFFGRIRTVRCFHDNVLFRQLLGEPGDGGVIVVDGGGSTAIALMGDMLAARACDSGWAGVNPAKSAKKGEGETDVAVEFGGVRFRPGEWVYCDEDGVLVSPAELR